MPNVLKAFKVQCPAKMQDIVSNAVSHLISTGTCLCPCSALKFLVLLELSCVMLFRGLFIVYCKIYYNLMRWTCWANHLSVVSMREILGPSLSCRPAVVHSVTDEVSKEPCSWFSEGLPPIWWFLQHWLHSRSYLTYSAFVATIIVLSPFSSLYAHFLLRLFRVPELLSWVASLCMSSTTSLWKEGCRMLLLRRAELLTEYILLVSDSSLTGLQTPSKSLSRSRHNTFILLTD